MDFAHVCGSFCFAVQLCMDLKFFMGSDRQTDRSTFSPLAQANQQENSSSCLICIGLSSCERQAIASKLARRLHWAWLDTDHILQAWFGQPLDEVRQRLGAEAYQLAQEKILLNLQVQRMVIAADSSVLTSHKLRDFFQQQGKIVFLKTADDSGLDCFYE